MKRLAFLIYSWGTTFLFAALLLWLAGIEDLHLNNDLQSDTAVKVLMRMAVYAMLFLLTFRSLLITFKSTVDRLSKWRSKKEKHEDAEFVLIIETLIVITVVLGTILFSILEVWVQTQSFLKSDDAKLQDISISTMSILLTAIVVYSMPVIGELEYAIKHKLEDSFGSKKKK